MKERGKGWGGNVLDKSQLGKAVWASLSPLPVRQSPKRPCLSVPAQLCHWLGAARAEWHKGRAGFRELLWDPEVLNHEAHYHTVLGVFIPKVWLHLGRLFLPSNRKNPSGQRWGTAGAEHSLEPAPVLSLTAGYFQEAT